MNTARRVLTVLVAACSAVAGTAASSTAATAYQVTLMPLADTVDAGTIQIVHAEVRSPTGKFAPDGTQVRFSTSGDDDDVVVPEFVGMAPHGTDGYWLANSAGRVLGFGSAPHWAAGDLPGSVVGIAAGPGDGYWLATDDGAVHQFGGAGTAVIQTELRGVDPVVGITSHGAGGWIVTAAGKVAAFGSATPLGDAPSGAGSVAGIVASDTGQGYRIFTATGAVFTFGDAVFRGDMRAVRLNKAIAGLINYGNNAYLLVGVDGGIFNFSDRPFAGSLGANPPTSPVSVAVAAPNGAGYWMLTTSGEVFPFGDARHVGSYWQVPTFGGVATFEFSSLSGGQITITASALGGSDSFTQTWTASPTGPRPDLLRPAELSGYWALAGDGAIYAFGDADHLGNGGTGALDVEPTPAGQGYWVLHRSGQVRPFGDAAHLGDADLTTMAKDEHPASLSATPSGRGYWVFTNRGRALAFGDAVHLGDMSQTKLNGPVLGSVATPSGKGYYMVASDGGIFAFDAPFRGSMGGTKLNRPVVGMVRYGDGYLMVGADGGIFNFSTAPFAGSLGAKPPAAPVVAVAALPT